MLNIERNTTMQLNNEESIHTYMVNPYNYFPYVASNFVVRFVYSLSKSGLTSSSMRKCWRVRFMPDRNGKEEEKVLESDHQAKLPLFEMCIISSIYTM